MPTEGSVDMPSRAHLSVAYAGPLGPQPGGLVHLQLTYPTESRADSLGEEIQKEISLSLSFVFLGPHPLHMKILRLGVESGLQLRSTP